MEASNLPDTEFKTLFIGMLNELRERVDELRENLHTERNHKQQQSEMKDIIVEMKTT